MMFKLIHSMIYKIREHRNWNLKMCAHFNVRIIGSKDNDKKNE